jgi:2-polyprenyl-3-methyl-5-hydroxy-6-metoxy-1,4-benzoquinol methylase
MKVLVWKILCRIPYFKLQFSRLRWANSFSKESFNLKSSPNVFETIYLSNFWKSNESVSGSGSEISTTRKIRETLPILWKKYSVKTVLDVPCGDFNWMKEVDKKGIIYRGGDIVEEIISKNNENYKCENISFDVIDITKDVLPKVDMIICKDCLQHLSYDDILKALQNFKKSGSKFLFTTSYIKTWKNWDIKTGDYRPLNLRIAPYNFPSPIFKMKEYVTTNNEPDKYMLLYDLDNLTIV